MIAQETSRLERALFLIHGVVTLAAGVVLAVFPSAIPASVGIAMEPEEFLLSYFLSAAELAVAMLSIGAARLNAPAAVRLIAASFVVFHLATAALELFYLSASSYSPVLAANVVLRFTVGAIFAAVWWRRWPRPTV